MGSSRRNLRDPVVVDLPKRISTLETQSPNGFSSVTRGTFRIASEEGLLVEGQAHVTGLLSGTGEIEWTGTADFTGDVTAKKFTAGVGDFNAVFDDRGMTSSGIGTRGYLDGTPSKSFSYEGGLSGAGFTFNTTGQYTSSARFGAGTVQVSDLPAAQSPTGMNLLLVNSDGYFYRGPNYSTGGSGGGSTGTGSGLTNPGSLSATAVDGTVYNFGWRQLENAVQILRAAMPIAGVTDRVLRITLMTAIVESVLWRYANTSTYPESAFIEHDRDGYDNDSLGLFQQRPQSGWGSVSQLMDTSYATRAFIGGPSGPNNGSPPGLFDLNWQGMSDGAAAQAVQVSAHPGRYANVGPVADALLAALIVDEGLMYPFPLSDSPEWGGYRYGPRESPGGIGSTYHEGIDWPKPAGTPVPSAGAGTVDYAGWHGQYTWGNLVIIDHGGGVRTWYAHMSSVAVSSGQTVTQGQTLGGVGTTGPSTGNHLHWGLEVNGSFIDPETYIV